MTKYLHRIFIILIFISVASAAYLFSNQQNKTISPPLGSPVTALPTATPEELIPARLEHNPNNTSQRNQKTEDKIPIPVTGSTTTPPTSSPPTENHANTLPITFIIDNKEYRLMVAPDTTAYDAMIQLQESKKISFSSKKFSGLGYFIEAINGIKNSPSTGFYWTLYINNQEAKIGASNYILKSNDIITWKYENK